MCAQCDQRAASASEESKEQIIIIYDYLTHFFLLGSRNKHIMVTRIDEMKSRWHNKQK